MKNTKVQFVLFCIISYLTLSGLKLNASEKIVTYGFDTDYPPFSYLANNTPQGYELDLIKLIFEKGDYKLDIKSNYTWDEIYKLVVNNQLDMCCPLVRTPERAKQIFFTDDVYSRYYGVFSNGSAEKMDVDDLGKYRLGAVKGYYSEIIVRDNLKISNYKVFENYLEMITALKENRIDAFVENTEVVKYYISKLNLVGQVILQHDGLFPQVVPFGVAKNRPDLVEFINKRLKEISASGEFEILYIKNFSAHSPEYYNAEKKKDRWIIIGITGGLAASALAFIALLKIQVKRASEKIIQREQELRKSEENFKAIIDTIPLAIHLTTGIEQVTQYINPTMVKLFGYTVDDIPSVEQWWPLAYPDETYRRQISEEWNARVRKAIETQTPIEPMEVVVNCKDGSKKNISWAYITLGDRNYSCGLDLTERKRAEAEIKVKNEELEAINEELNAAIEEMEAANEELTETYESLLESEERIHSISNNIQSGMIYQAVIDKDGSRKFTYLSSSVKLLYGISPEEAMADPVLIYGKVYRDDRERLAAEEEYAIKTRSTFKTEIRMISPSGDIRWSSFVSIPRVLENGVICFDGIEFDITEQKKAQERINILLKEKELLLQEVHHRIKNNLNTVKGLLALQITAEENPSAAASLRDAESRVQSMIMLYDRLYSTENYREMSVKDYLQSLAEEIIGSFPNRGIMKIETDIEDFILNVNILTPLGIIVNELVTNMMKYAFPGKDSGVLIISAAIKNSHVKIVVQDNGIGIPESVGFNNSSGFGLDLVGMLVEQIGGSVIIERGDGTKFLLEFDV